MPETNIMLYYTSIKIFLNSHKINKKGKNSGGRGLRWGGRDNQGPGPSRDAFATVFTITKGYWKDLCRSLTLSIYWMFMRTSTSEIDWRGFQFLSVWWTTSAKQPFPCKAARNSAFKNKCHLKWIAELVRNSPRTKLKWKQKSRKERKPALQLADAQGSIQSQWKRRI